jgi:hypothetical protein
MSPTLATHIIHQLYRPGGWIVITMPRVRLVKRWQWSLSGCRSDGLGISQATI